MKIIFYASTMGGGGAERTVSYLSDYLSKDNKVYVLTQTKGCFYKLNRKVKYMSFPILCYPNRKYNLWRPDIFYRRVHNLINKKILFKLAFRLINPDIVCCMMANAAESILPLKQEMRFALVTSERSNPIFEDSELVEKRKQIFHVSDGIVFQTLRAKQFYDDNIQGKSVIIPNAVGNPYIKKIPQEVIRENFVVAIGRLSYEKGYDILLKAFRMVVDKYSDIKLRIYGIGNERSNILNLIHDLGIENNVILMGAKPDAIIEASKAKCYVLASRYEGMPNSLMEAMAAGIPCVSTDCPNGPRELIINNENGLLVSVDDPIEMSQAILKMVEDEKFAENCSKKARDILQTNSISKICKQYSDFFLKVLNEGMSE